MHKKDSCKNASKPFSFLLHDDTAWAYMSHTHTVLALAVVFDAEHSVLNTHCIFTEMWSEWHYLSREIHALVDIRGEAELNNKHIRSVHVCECIRFMCLRYHCIHILGCSCNCNPYPKQFYTTWISLLAQHDIKVTRSLGFMLHRLGNVAIVKYADTTWWLQATFHSVV